MFQTKVKIPDSPLKISHQDSILSLGSCFAENIGKRLTGTYFDVDINPFGVLYNPLSIKNSLNSLMDKQKFTKDDLFENRGLWQSFSHSSLFSDISEELCLNKINERFLKAKEQLKTSRQLIITFGTAWVYDELKSGRVVSNCHKLPSNVFNRRRLSVEEIVDNYTELFEKLFSYNPDLELIFSVSPIRHWKDGAHENNISKSTLLLSINSLQENFSTVHYFPAYEIQLDELRDYRFYGADMQHPSDVAVNYIWERFKMTYFSTSTIALIEKLEQLNDDLNHRPLFPQSDEYKLFVKSIETRKLRLVKEYPFLEGHF
ncbi:MAG: GSCFA domain-containing protein [Paludibacter sp.]|nr:GSCFA domain-containing protein [Paludibacter sp.]